MFCERQVLFNLMSLVHRKVHSATGAHRKDAYVISFGEVVLKSVRPKLRPEMRKT